MLRRVIQVAAERRTEVVRVARRVGDEVVAPIVEHAPVRVGKAVGDVALKFARARLVAVNAGVIVPHRSLGGLNLRAVEHAVAQIGRAAGIQHHRVGGMVRIG